jgi:hypothetical protein
VNYPKISLSSILSLASHPVMLPHVIMFQKRLWYSIKKKKEKKRKRTNVPLKIKRDLAAQVFLNVFKFLREVYEISQRR